MGVRTEFLSWSNLLNCSSSFFLIPQCLGLFGFLLIFQNWSLSVLVPSGIKNALGGCPSECILPKACLSHSNIRLYLSCKPTSVLLYLLFCYFGIWKPRVLFVGCNTYLRSAFMPLRCNYSVCSTDFAIWWLYVTFIFHSVSYSS